MGGTAADTADVIATIFFVSGLNTLLQTTFGDRLPIIQGGSFAFLTPTFGIIFHPEIMSMGMTDAERFLYTMRVIQGAVFVVGIVQVALGYTGLLVPFIKLFSPVSIAPTVAMIGLGLAGAMEGNMRSCEWMWVIGVLFFVLFGQIMAKVQVPVGKGYKLPIFALFPVIFTIAITWMISGIAEAAADNLDPSCKTVPGVFEASRGARFPYPGQWGAPIFKGWAIGPLMGAMVVSMTESIGDYYACAKLAGAPPPSGAAVARGLATEGWGLILCGLFGTSNGTTSYGENIGAISITKVGSRAVVQTGGLIMVIVGLFPKFGAIFVAMPSPIIAALYSVCFGLIASSGLSLLQHADMSSNRNLFILGFCLYNGLAMAGGAGNPNQAGGSYFAGKLQAGLNPFGADDNFFMIFFNNTMVMSLLCGVILDNIIPGTKEERGKSVFEGSNSLDSQTDESMTSVYGLPWCLPKVFRNCVYLDFIYLGGKWPTKPEGGYKASHGDCCEMLCPCVFPKYAVDEKGEVDVKVTSETAAA